jgi:hypothetical protein
MSCSEWWADLASERAFAFSRIFGARRKPIFVAEDTHPGYALPSPHPARPCIKLPPSARLIFDDITTATALKTSRRKIFISRR